MKRSTWLWAHTATLLAHGIYLATGAVAFVVSGTNSMGNFKESLDKCNSACVMKAWGSSVLAICAGAISLILFTVICRYDKHGPMTPERFNGSSRVIKIGWGLRLLLAWAEYYLCAAISQHLIGCSIMRAPYLLGLLAALLQLVVIYADYTKYLADKRTLDEVLAPDLPSSDPETPATPSSGFAIPIWSSRFTDRLVEV